MKFVGEEPWLKHECSFCLAGVGERCVVQRREAITQGSVISHGTPHTDRIVEWQTVTKRDYDPAVSL